MDSNQMVLPLFVLCLWKHRFRMFPTTVVINLLIPNKKLSRTHRDYLTILLVSRTIFLLVSHWLSFKSANCACTVCCGLFFDWWNKLWTEANPTKQVVCFSMNISMSISLRGTTILRRLIVKPLICTSKTLIMVKIKVLVKVDKNSYFRKIFTELDKILFTGKKCLFIWLIFLFFLF